MTTVLSRGTRPRRGSRRPGWTLLTALLVLAIGASSALVFTNRVELLKFAVILALWAAVVAAFASVLYRRQSDTDRVRARDLKLVYDLQLDREISARREYELTVESQLRRELASELQAEAADEVAALRAELTALRTNLEILFDTDLDHRPALETERTSVRADRDWTHDDRASVRSEHSQTVENPIIDVPEVRVPPAPPVGESLPGPQRQPGHAGGAHHAAETHAAAGPTRGSHRRASDEAGWSPEPDHWQERREPFAPPPPEPGFEPWPATPPAATGWGYTPPERGPRPQSAPWTDAPPAAPRPVHRAADWQPVAADGQWLPPGTPGSNWVSASYEPAAEPNRAMFGEPRARHASPAESAPIAAPESPARHGAEARRVAARHSTESANPLGAAAPSTPAAEPRHQSQPPDSRGSRTSGESVAELLARLQGGQAGGGRRRRREE